MKFSIIITFLLFILVNVAIAEYPELDDYDIEGSVDMAAFLIGSDNYAGGFYYIVIRTTDQCFLLHQMRSDKGSAMSKIDCKSLTIIPQIKEYIDTGKRP